MIFAYLILTALLLGIGLFINDSNAATLLSGYNSMSAEEKKAFNLKDYIPLLKKFHLILGSSLFVFCLLTEYIWGSDSAMLVMVIYPLSAYIWFIFYSRQFQKDLYPKNKWVPHFAAAILILCLIFVCSLFYTGWQDNKITITESEIRIDGMYGENIPLSEIDSVQFVTALPKIVFRSNGFATGEILKGYFKIAGYGKVKLIINEKNASYLCIKRKIRERIYYASPSIDEKAMVAELEQKLSAK